MQTIQKKDQIMKKIKQNKINENNTEKLKIQKLNEN